MAWNRFPNVLPPVAEDESWMDYTLSVPVLAFVRFDRPGTGGYTVIATLEHWRGPDEPGPCYRWYTYDSERWRIDGKVTHWAPLPKPPKETS